MVPRGALCLFDDDDLRFVLWCLRYLCHDLRIELRKGLPRDQHLVRRGCILGSHALDDDCVLDSGAFAAVGLGLPLE